jgi:hypothetical protein
MLYDRYINFPLQKIRICNDKKSGDTPFLSPFETLAGSKWGTRLQSEILEYFLRTKSLFNRVCQHLKLTILSGLKATGPQGIKASERKVLDLIFPIQG